MGSGIENKLSKRKVLGPVVLSVVGVEPEILFHFLVCPFRLPVGLRVVP